MTSALLKSLMLTEDTQPKFVTRSTARHLRRKRLNEARRAEKQLSSLVSVSDTSVKQESQISKSNTGKAEVLTKSKARRLRKKAKSQENCHNNEYYPFGSLFNYTTANDCDAVAHNKSGENVAGAQFRSVFSLDTKHDNTEYGNRLKRIGRRLPDIDSAEDSSDLSRSSDTPFWLSTIRDMIQWGLAHETTSESKCSSVTSTSASAQDGCTNDEKSDYSDTASLNESIENPTNKTALLVHEEDTIDSTSKTVETVEFNTSQQHNQLFNDKCSSASLVIQEISEDSESRQCANNRILDLTTTQSRGRAEETLITRTSSVQTGGTVAVQNSLTVENTLNGTASDSKIIVKMSANVTKVPEKTREEVKAEREAKKAAKAAAKAKAKGVKVVAKADSEQSSVAPDISKKSEGVDQTDTASVGHGNLVKRICTSFREIHPEVPKQDTTVPVSQVETKSKALLRAERRAKQEAQRAAKQESSAGKVKSKANDTLNVRAPTSVQVPVATSETVKKIAKKVVPKEDTHEVNLFKHLYHERELALIKVPVVNSKIHPAIVRLGVQYENKVIMGSNARCIALLAAVKQLIQDFERPSQADFIRGLETSLQECGAYLHHCRPLAVSMQNALRHLKWQMTQLPSSVADEEAKERLANAIDTYILEQIQLAGKAISITIQTKISNGNVILTYGYSSLIHKILLDAHLAGKQFRVIVVDGRPWLEGKEQLRRLAKHGIECSYVLINALSYVMPEVSKVFLGAHAILANGAVMSRVGTAQVALMARAFNVPVLVACETHKSCERVQTDSIVYNELGDANELTRNFLSDAKASLLSKWRTKKHLNLLNITYDVTPADLVTAVVTELAILPCTSVPVILRIKPSEI